MAFSTTGLVNTHVITSWRSLLQGQLHVITSWRSLLQVVNITSWRSLLQA